MEDSVWSFLKRGVPWIVLGAVGWTLAQHLRRVRRARRRASRSLRGEADAVAVLADAGFRVQRAQVVRSMELRVDGATLSYEVRADYLVRDWLGRRYVAEVKTGGRAPDPLHPPTRRQLLEYQIGYPEARAVLLVDMEARAVLRVRFPV